MIVALLVASCICLTIRHIGNKAKESKTGKTSTKETNTGTPKSVNGVAKEADRSMGVDLLLQTAVHNAEPSRRPRAAPIVASGYQLR